MMIRVNYEEENKMIKIITVYQTLNPGSFLQATALYNTVKEIRNDVSFFNTKARHPFMSGVKLSLKLLKKGKIKCAIEQYKMMIDYKKALRTYSVTQEKSNDDIFVIGSDEVWNVSRKDIAKFPIFWGKGLRQERCIAYAPSINNSCVHDLENCEFVEESLNRLAYLSVRDKYSQEILTNFTDRNIELVCDPVMLQPVKNYKEMYNKKERNFEYVLLYGPKSHFDKCEIDEIIIFSKKNNLKILSYYFFHDFVDEVIYGDPYVFLELIDSAYTIFTSTFHGAVFSVMYNKSFVAFGKSKKQSELLSSFELKNRIYKKGELEKIVDEVYDYSQVNNKIAVLSEYSKNYLFNSLKKLF